VLTKSDTDIIEAFMNPNKLRLLPSLLKLRKLRFY
jgi:hypothetical protein